MNRVENSEVRMRFLVMRTARNSVKSSKSRILQCANSSNYWYADRFWHRTKCWLSVQFL